MTNSEYEALERRIDALEKAVFTGNAPVEPLVSADPYDWTLNERAFVTRYAKDMTGTEKFTLLAAYTVKGEYDAAITLAAIEKLWNKMTARSLLGIKFNRKYTSQAKANGWVDGAGQGKYQLAYGWTEIQHAHSAVKED